jgi:hypothetical protein
MPANPIPFNVTTGEPLDKQGRHLVVARLALEDVMKQLEQAQGLVDRDTKLDELVDRALLHSCIAYEEIVQVEEQW